MLNKRHRKLISLLMSFLMAVLLFPIAALADGNVAFVDGVGYPSLQDAVDVAGDGAKITLKGNTSGSGVKVPSCKNITIDFGGFTYEIVAPTVGSTGTETNGFQLLRDSTIVMQNGTIHSSVARILIQNYSNLTLHNMNLDGSELAGSNDYVLSNNHGTTKLTGSTSITAKEGDVAFDVCYWSPAYADGVEVIVDTVGAITGKIEYSTYGTSTPESTAANSALEIKNVSHVGDIAVAEGANISISGGSYSSPTAAQYVNADNALLFNGQSYDVLPKTEASEKAQASVVTADGKTIYYANGKDAANDAQNMGVSAVYKLTVTTEGNGSFTVDPNAATMEGVAEGTKVKIAFTPASSYTLSSIVINGTALTDIAPYQKAGFYEYNMTAGQNDVTLLFKRTGTYIPNNGSSNGGGASLEHDGTQPESSKTPSKNDQNPNTGAGGELQYTVVLLLSVGVLAGVSFLMKKKQA